MITFPATLTKAQISETAAIKGKVYIADVSVDGGEPELQSVKFCGFVGVRQDDGTYCGELRFEPVEDLPTGSADEFYSIPGIRIGVHGDSETTEDGEVMTDG